MTNTSWHRVSIDQIFKELNSSTLGLSDEEVRQRRKKYGSNFLPKKEIDGWLKILYGQFKSPLIFILFLAILVSVWLKDFTDAVVIGIAVALNTIVGFAQEFKANRSLKHLRSLLQPQCLVLRDGQEERVAASEVVPGDILLLRSGDHVSADARIFEAVELQTNEAALTGESLPIQKQVENISAHTNLAERKNMIYAGTTVVSGRGRAIVVATGLNSQLGAIATLVEKTHEPRTPLQEQLAHLARWIGALVLVLVFLLFVLGIFSGRASTEMFELSVALAVAAIPEGLTVSVTIILAIGMQRILRRKSLVRKLVAAETLGSVSVICTDKTGTITEGEMRATHLVSMDETISLDSSAPSLSQTIEDMILAIGLCNDAALVIDSHEKSGFRIEGSPTEKALLSLFQTFGHDQKSLLRDHPRLAEIPFDSSRKFMITAHAWGSESRLFLKGASTAVLGFSNKLFEKGKVVDLTSHDIKRIETKEKELTSQGFRLIAVAMKSVSKSLITIDADKKDFIFLGFVGLHDPVRANVKSQVMAAKAAGVRTIMITGDHPETARVIGEQIGLVSGIENVVTGVQLDEWSDGELQKRLSRITIYARTEPRHKIRIIAAWTARGEVVAMTGDGVNDAPALKAADIGMAVGSGTEVAKQASDVVILDNNLGTITAAIEEGRVIFDNIRKTTVYLLADSFTEIVLIGGSIALGLPIPLLPAQILWINLVADTLPNVGLTLEPGEKDVMRLPPRSRKEPVLNKEMLTLIFVIGIVTDVVLFILYVWLLRSGQSLENIRSIMFAAVGIDSLLYIFAVKSFRRTIFQINPFSNLWLVGGVVAGFALMTLAFIHPFFQSLFEVSALGLWEWGLLLMIGIIKLIAIETGKQLLFRKRFYVAT